MPSLALVLNTHKRRADIKRSLLYVRSMDFMFNEIHVVNDGVSHDYKEYVKILFNNVSNGAEHYFLHNTNGKGGVGARLHAVNQIKSDIVSFWDDDDILTPEYFNNVILHFSRFPQSMLLTSNYVRLYNLGSKVIMKGEVEAKEILGENKIGGFSFITLPIKSASILSQVPINLKAGQDWFLYYLIYRKYGLKNIHRSLTADVYYNDKMSKYRITGGDNINSLKSLATIVTLMNNNGENYSSERLKLLRYRMMQQANTRILFNRKISLNTKLTYLKHCVKRLLS